MDYQKFIAEFEKLTGIRLEFYKEKQMKRRTETLIQRKGLNSYEEFCDLLRSDPEELEFYRQYITINVTEFFRTPAEWKIFEEKALAFLLRKEGGIKIWSTACSTGEEPYSLAMSMLKMAEDPDYDILATDLDRHVLEQAEKGRFTEQALEKLSEADRGRFFLHSDSEYEVSEKLKEKIRFRQFDLVQDEFPKDLDLIVCRNVLIYFTEEAKDRIYCQFLESLRPGGYLFTGNTEQLIYYKKFGFRKLANFLYRKPEA